MRNSLLVSFVLALICLPINTRAEQTEPGKKKITSIDDLPRHSYHVPETVTELITSERTFAPFAAKLRNDIETDLATYEIEDKTTLRGLYQVLVSLDMLESDYDSALEGLERMRELQDKPAERLTTGLVIQSIIFARREVGTDDFGEYRRAFSRYLSHAIEDLPWEVVQERVEETKGKAEMYTENFLLGVVQSHLESAAEKTHQIGSDIAEQAVRIRYLLEVQLPLQNEIVGVYEEYITANRVEKANIWQERSVDLTETKDLHPVLVAIWDTGIDTDVFPDQLFVNTEEILDGKDNDGNGFVDGFVDDLHGIAYTLEDEKTPDLLYFVEDAEKRLPEMKEMLKGYFDLEGAIDSPEAAALKQKIAEMRPEDVRTYFEDLMQFILYVHGTHVAGVAVEGNSAARILVARLTADYRTVPLPPSVERAHRAARMAQEVVAYFKAQGVRVVNMSWGASVRDTESDLEANGIGADAAERARLAREIFDIQKDALYDAIKGAPEILFVNSAGNENDDVSFENYFPAAFDLPNLLTVGAVDQAGDETSFTSFGERVQVYANGFEVESYLPGGDRMKASGTSASSPNVVNLAAKLLALDPSLTTDEVVSLIKEGGDRTEDRGLLLINPKRSVELLKSLKK
jgi:subtilisin family serine protease